MRNSQWFIKRTLFGVPRTILWIAFVLTSTRLPAARIHCWATGDSVKIMRDTPMQAQNYVWNGTDKRVSIKGGRGETVAFQIVLRSESDLDGVTVDIPGFHSRQYSFPDGSVELFREFYVSLRPDPAYMARRWFSAGEYPDALIPFRDPYDKKHPPVGAPFPLAAGKNQPVWVDVRIPRDARPGTYESRIIVSAWDMKYNELKVRLTVCDFEIPLDWKLPAFMDIYMTNMAKGEGVRAGRDFHEETKVVLQRYDIMAYRHGFFNMQWWPSPHVEFDSTGKLTKIDWTDYDKYYSDLLSGKLLGVKPACWKVPLMEYQYFIKQDWKTQKDVILTIYREYSREIAKHFTEKGWTDPILFVYTIDEPGNWYKGSEESIAEIADAVREGSGDLFRFLIPGSKTHAAGHANFWAIYPSDYRPKELAPRQKAGDLIWFYQGCHEWQGLPVAYIPNYGLAMRLWAWIAWKYESDGMLYWASTSWGDHPYTEGAAFDDPRWGPGNGKFFYPGNLLTQIDAPAIHGPVSSIRMKMWRRGMQDYQFFWMLEAKRKKDMADATVNRLVKRALSDGENEQLKEGGWETWDGNWSKNPDDYYKAIWDIRNQLTMLYRGGMTPEPLKLSFNSTAGSIPKPDPAIAKSLKRTIRADLIAAINQHEGIKLEFGIFNRIWAVTITGVDDEAVEFDMDGEMVEVDWETMSESNFRLLIDAVLASPTPAEIKRVAEYYARSNDRDAFQKQVIRAKKLSVEHDRAVQSLIIDTSNDAPDSGAP